jgi:hypothetical protein
VDIRRYVLTRICTAGFKKKWPVQIVPLLQGLNFFNFVLRVNTYCFEANVRCLKCLVVVSDVVANRLLQGGDVCLYSGLVLHRTVVTLH